jgi:hypothetical protein
MAKATAIGVSVIEVLAESLEGWLEVPCEDYDAYKALPLLVRFRGRRYSRSSWNSDKERAYYRPGSEDLAFGEGS